MNKIFNVIYSITQQDYVVCSELAKQRTKVRSYSSGQLNIRRLAHFFSLSILAVAIFSATSLDAAPIVHNNTRDCSILPNGQCLLLNKYIMNNQRDINSNYLESRDPWFYQDLLLGQKDTLPPLNLRIDPFGSFVDQLHSLQRAITNLRRHSDIHYVSVKGSSGQTNYNNDGAEISDAIAIGGAASAGSDGSSMYQRYRGNPYDPYTNQQGNLAPHIDSSGSSEKVLQIAGVPGTQTAAPISIGAYSSANGAGVSLGYGAETKTMAIAIGSLAHADDSSISLGAGAYSTGDTAIALGRQTAAIKSFAIAIGNVAAATDEGSLAVGHSATAQGYRSIAIGSADVNQERSDGASNNNPLQTDGEAYAPTNLLTSANGDQAIAFGGTAQATGNNNIAFGSSSVANGNDNIAMGHNAQAQANEALAFGLSANAGNASSIALGSNSTTTFDNSVAIGSGSVTTADVGAQGYDIQTGNTTTQTTGAWQSTAAAVAVGNGSQVTRQITGVAAGTNDTDAVNVAQLKRIQTAYTGDNTTTIITRSPSQNLQIIGGATGETITNGIKTVGNPNGSISIQLAQVLNGLKTVGVGGVTIDSAKGIDAGKLPISNVPDDPTAGDQAVNKNYVDKLWGLGWSLNANNATVGTVGLGTVVNFQDGQGTKVDATSAGENAFNVSYDVNVDNKTITINKAGQLVASTPSSSFQVGAESGTPITVNSSNNQFNITGKTGGNITTAIDGNNVTIDLNDATKTALANAQNHTFINKATLGEDNKLTLDYNNDTKPLTVDLSGLKTQVQGSSNVNVTGNGTTASPYTVRVATTNLSTGNGIVNDPNPGASQDLVTAGNLVNVLNSLGIYMEAQSANSFIVNPGTVVNFTNGDNNILISSDGISTLNFNLNNQIVLTQGTITGINNNVNFVDATSVRQRGSNAASLSDVLRMGWILQGNGKKKLQVNPYDVVNFEDGNGTSVEIRPAGPTTAKLKYNVNVDGTTIKINDNNQLTADLSGAKIVLAQGTNTTLVGNGTAANPYKVNVADMRVKSGEITYGPNGVGSEKITMGDGTIATINGLKNTYVNGATFDTTSDKLTLTHNGGENPVTVDLSGLKAHMTAGTNTTLDGDGTAASPYKVNVADMHVKSGAMAYDNKGQGTLTLTSGDGTTTTITGVDNTFINKATLGSDNKLSLDYNNGQAPLSVDLSGLKAHMTAGTNTTLEGDGTATSPYKVNVADMHVKSGAMAYDNKGQGTLTLTSGDGTTTTITGVDNTFVNKATLGSDNKLSLDYNNGQAPLSVDLSGLKAHMTAGTNTTLEGDGTAASPYKVNVADMHVKSGAMAYDNKGQGTLTLTSGDGTTTTITGVDNTFVNKATLGSDDKLSLAYNNGQTPLSVDLSGLKAHMTAGTNTTLEGDGTAASPYKVNVADMHVKSGAMAYDNKGQGTLTLTSGDGTTTTITGVDNTFVNKATLGSDDKLSLAYNNGQTPLSVDLSGLKAHMTAGTNTTLDGDGTSASPYKVNVADMHVKSGAMAYDKKGQGTLTLTSGDGTTTTITGVDNTFVNKATLGSDNKLSLDYNNGQAPLSVDLSGLKAHMTAGTNTTLEGDGTATSPYKVNVADMHVKSGAMTYDNKGQGTLTLTSGDGTKTTITGVDNTFINKATLGSDNKLSLDYNNGQAPLSVDLSGLKAHMAAGTNTTLEGDGTATSPYKVNVADMHVKSGAMAYDNKGQGTLTLTSGDGTTTTITGVDNTFINKATLGSDNKLSLDYNNGQAPLSVDLSGLKAHMAAGTNTTLDGDGTATSPFIVNVATTPLTVSNGKVTAPTAEDAGKLATAGDIAKAVNGVGFNIEGNGASPEFIPSGAMVNFVNGNATTATVSKDGTTPTVKYDVAVDNDTIKIENGKLTATVSAGDLDLHYKANGKTPDNSVSLAEGLDFMDGANTTVKVEADGKVIYSVNPALTNIKSISNGTDGKGATITLGDTSKTVDVGGSRITGVGTPTAPTDAVNKGYVDGQTFGLSGDSGKVTTQLNKTIAVTGVKDNSGIGIQTTASGTGLTIGLTDATQKAIADGQKHTQVLKGENVTSVIAAKADNGAPTYIVNVDDMRVKSGTVSYSTNGAGTATLQMDGTHTATITGLKDTYVNGATFDASKDELTLNHNDGKNPVTVDLSGLKTHIAAGTNTKLEGDGTAKTPYKVDVADMRVKSGEITYGPNGVGSEKLTMGDGTIATINGLKNTYINGGTFDTTNDKLTLTHNGGENPVTVDLSGLKAHMTAGTNTTLDGDGTAASPYKVNVATTPLTVSNGKVIAPTAADADKLATAGSIAKALQNIGFTIEANGKNPSSIKGGDVINLNNIDNNISIDSNGNGTITFGLDNNIHLTNGSISGIQNNIQNLGKADVEKISDHAASLGDTLSMGWNVQENNKAVTTIHPFDTVNFSDGKATTVSVKTNKNTTVVKYNVDVDGKTIKIIDNKLTATVSASNLDLSYKANADKTSQSVSLSEGLDFINGTNTTAKVEADGKVIYNVNPDLTQINSISNGTDGKGATITLGSTEKTVDVGGSRITNVGTPTSPTDAVNKGYVDGQTFGLSGDSGKATTQLNKTIAVTGVKDNSGIGIQTTASGTGLTIGLTDATQKAIADGQKHTQVLKGANVTSVIAAKADNGAPTYTVNVDDMRVKSGTVSYSTNGAGTATLQMDGTHTATITGLKDTYVNGGSFNPENNTLTLTHNDNSNPVAINLSGLRINIVNGDSTTVEGNGSANDPYRINITTGDVTITPDGKAQGPSTLLPDQIKTLKDDLNKAHSGMTSAENALNSANKALASAKTPAEKQQAQAKVTAAQNALKAAQDALTKAQNAYDGAGLNKVATAQSVADAINHSGFNVQAAANGGELIGSANKTIVHNGDLVKFEAGKNLQIQQDGQNFTYSLNPKIEVQQVTVKGTDPNDKGVAITSSVGSDKTPTLQLGSQNKPVRIANVADGTAPNDAVNHKQLKEVEGEITDMGNKAINFGGDDGQAVSTKLGDTLNIQGGVKDPTKLTDGNIGVITDPTNHSLKVKLAKDLKDLGSVQLTDTKGKPNIKLDGQSGTITGLTNTKFNPNNIDPSRAATEGEVNDVYNAAKVKTKVTAGDGGVIVNNIGTDQAPNYKISIDPNQIAQGTNIHYRANGGAVQSVSLDTGFNFTNGTNTTAVVGKDGNVTYKVNPDLSGINSISNGKAGTGAKITLDKGDKNINVNGGKVTGVADGTVSPDSTDAVNGKQLYQTQQQVDANKNAIAANTQHIADNAGNIAANKQSIANNTQKIAENGNKIAQNTQQIDQVKDHIDQVTGNIDKNSQAIKKGLNIAGNTGSGDQALGSTVNVVGSAKAQGSTYSSDNVTTTYTQDKDGNGIVKVEMKEKPTFKGIEVTDNQGNNKVSVSTTSTHYQGDKGAVPTVSLSGGTDKNGKAVPVRIEHVADGVRDDDAANMGQVRRLAQGVSNGFTKLSEHVNDVDKHARAGIASAGAIATLPQAIYAGRSQVAAAVTQYRGQSALAIGYSTVSDNSKWTLRFTGSTNTQKDTMVGVGAGYSW